MTFDALLENLRHASAEGKQKSHVIKFSCVFYRYLNVYYSSE